MSRLGSARQILTEHEDEPVAGLPGRLPEGETVLWQGAPRVAALARSLHVRELAGYFLLLLAIRTATAWTGDAAALAGTVLPLFGVSALALGLILLFAWLSARTTLYTVTNRRLVVRYGVALSKALNISFTMVDSAALRLSPDSTGSISLRLSQAGRVPYVMLWPHVRPWHLSRAEPTLRAIPDAALVAQRLSRALASATGGQVGAVSLMPGSVPELEPGGAVTA